MAIAFCGAENTKTPSKVEILKTPPQCAYGLRVKKQCVMTHCHLATRHAYYIDKPETFLSPSAHRFFFLQNINLKAELKVFCSDHYRLNVAQDCQLFAAHFQGLRDECVFLSTKAEYFLNLACSLVTESDFLFHQTQVKALKQVLFVPEHKLR